jgi:hypothetical protein
VERWRTRALLGALVLIAAGGVVAVVLAQTDESSLTSNAGRTPQISASAESPLTVDGVLKGVKECDSINVTAAGSMGSRASFNLSSYVCIEP